MQAGSSGIGECFERALHGGFEGRRSRGIGRRTRPPRATSAVPLARRAASRPTRDRSREPGSAQKDKNRLAVRADAQTEAALLEVLESFCSGFAARNADGVMRLFAPDADVVMVTSEEPLLRGPDEIRAFLQRYVRGRATYSWTWDRRDASASGAVGWLLAEGTETAAAEGREEKHPYRMSVVCEQTRRRSAGNP